ncbi:sigma-54-dependent Fis family transcriptional regulator [candidate division KSB1 bacterium]|nr:sigma-54-dependent Fis family transcriptional regulator [candidate division KSB1 bacterium]
MNDSIFIIDDDQSMCEFLQSDLTRRGLKVTWSLAAESAVNDIFKGDYDVVLTDLNMPGMNGIELCDRIVANRPDIPVIVLTAFGSLETAIGAIRAGAYDFVTKPVDNDILALVLERALKHRALEEQIKRLNATVQRYQVTQEIIGESRPICELLDQLARIAEVDASVLINGESGSGKELVARALHKQSQRKDGPFIAINCSAVPETLLESELFGHKKGAFTDAKADRKGLFLQANGGTLFFDEVGDIPLILQPKLLRALEERRIRPLGGNDEVEFDVRILAATNRDLESEIAQKNFRQDLYFRLNVIQIDVPPLRLRGNDILLLAHHFIDFNAQRMNKSIKGLLKATAQKLMAYEWPGNVRELKNAMERAVALCQHDKISVQDLPEKIRSYASSGINTQNFDFAELLPLDDIERRYISHVLTAVGGNRSVAAKILGIDRKTLYRKITHYNLT